MKLPFPEKAIAQHTIVLGKTGAGKSYAMRGLVEWLLEHGHRVCVIDPKGDWFGLRSDFPVVIFGGEHADIPLNAHSGAQVAELIATGNRPSIIDFGGWMVGERTRFWIDFAAGIFRHNRSPLWLVIDEVHNFAPQGKVMDVDSAKCLHWTNRLGSEGRGKGLRILMASQRPQKVHKDLITCAETLIAMRVIHPRDREAIKEWIDGCGDPKQGVEILNSLAQMPRGEGWVWSPEIGFLERIKFPTISTFDSFAAPTSGTRKKMPGWSEIDLDDVKQQFSQVIEDAKANDPAELKRQLADLRKQLKQVPVAGNPITEIKEVSVLTTEDRRQIESAKNNCEKVLGLFEKEATKIQDSVQDMRRFFSGLESKLKLSVPVRSVPKHIASVQAHSQISKLSSAPSNGLLGKCERSILTALAQYPQGRTSVQAAVLAGYSVNSGGWNNSLGKLRSAGYITREQPMRITEEGLAVLGPFDPLPIGDELQRHWLNQLGKCERKILNCVLHVFPSGMDTEQIASETGYSSNSGGFNNALGRLRTLELITRGRPIKAADHFFQ